MNCSLRQTHCIFTIHLLWLLLSHFWFFFCWRYSNIRQSSSDCVSSLLFFVVVLFNAPSQRFLFQSGYLCPKFSFFLVVAAGLPSWSWLFSWLQAVLLTTDTSLINKWVTTLRRHGRIRQILIPSSPKNWDSCHRDESKMLSPHAKDDKRCYATQKLTCVHLYLEKQKLCI